MNKLIPALAGTAAASGAGLGGYVWFSKKVETIEDKYKSALLDDSSNLWDKKWEKIKSSEPVHETLRKAKEKATSESPISKSLHRQGCMEIYSSPLENFKYLEDLKNYCSKNISDVVTGGNWIADDDQNTKWDTPLKALKEKGQASLPKDLGDIVSKLTTTTGTTFQQAERKLLKDWCDKTKDEIATDDLKDLISNAQLYCLSAN
ncbi:hypothetical protein MHF_0892 [Mycoplasma haemofelis Ohio2]|uniref:Uncharacterized protein n=1 Tax=Mycoplasma haemofelis (strain Ohio2) TaxID=859194 RepID=F6FIV2_MYCHI|nr:hypothetical protein MHF_0892 [Mycoplasma haemofelis Ohio2]